MIVDLPSTTTAAVSKKLVRLRNDVGAMALGRVLTLLIIADESDADEAIEAANDASRQHPCRIIAIVTGNKRGASRLDAQIRVGGDAGASEVVVLRLYGALADHGDSVITPLLLPDSPVVAWWPRGAPETSRPTRSVPWPSAGSPTRPRHATRTRRCSGARRRIHPGTPTSPGPASRCGAACWPRRWTSRRTSRSISPPSPVAATPPRPTCWPRWLAQTLKCTVTRARTRAGTGMVSVRLERRGGDIDLVRPDGVVATLVQPVSPCGGSRCRGASWPSAWPTSCAGWTLTRSTPRR